MISKTQLLEQRQKMNKKRPKFLRQDYHHRIKVSDDYWRAPMGGQSKMRQRIRGHRVRIAVGYRSPVLVRGLHRSGAKFVHIKKLTDLYVIRPNDEIAILSSNLGAKKRHEILKAALERNIKFANVNAAKFVADFEAKVKLKKETKVAAAKPVAVKTEVKTEVKAEAPKVATEKTEAPKTKPKSEPKEKKEAKK